jgi:hypothetical protein
MVKVTLKGTGELAAVEIDDSLMAPGEGEVIADLIVAAHADAKRKLDAKQAEMMREAAGPLAGMMGGPGMPGSRSSSGRLRRTRDRAPDRPAGQAAGPGSALGAARGPGPAQAARQLLGPLADALAEARPGEDLLGLRLAGHQDPCAICSDRTAATAGLICVVEEVGALWAMERASAFRGRYHVLGGLLSALDGVGPEACASASCRPRLGSNGARGDPGPAGHRRRPDHRPLPRRTPRGRQRRGHHAGARRARSAATWTGWTTAPSPRPCGRGDRPRFQNIARIAKTTPTQKATQVPIIAKRPQASRGVLIRGMVPADGAWS